MENKKCQIPSPPGTCTAASTGKQTINDMSGGEKCSEGKIKHGKEHSEVGWGGQEKS